MVLLLRENLWTRIHFFQLRIGLVHSLQFWLSILFSQEFALMADKPS